MKNLTTVEIQTIENLKDIISQHGEISELLMVVHNLVVHHIEFCAYSEDDRNNLYSLHIVAETLKPLEVEISQQAEDKEINQLNNLLIEKEKRIRELEIQISKRGK